MIILPATDIYDGKVVRLYKGDYAQMTVYSEKPLHVAKGFAACGAEFLHVVDLEGARDGTTPNRKVVEKLVEKSGLSVEIGGGIRTEDTIRTYIDIGVARVILGTTAATDPVFLEKMVDRYADRIAVGVDIRDGYVAIKGWTEQSEIRSETFFQRLQQMGVVTVIVTDISRDGAMRGTNMQLYKELRSRYSMQIIASGGVSTLDEIIELREIDVYGTILGKSIYTGDIQLADAIKLARVNRP